MSKIIFILSIVGGALCTDSSREWCGENVNFKEPAAGSCKGYWECDNGTMTYKTCGRLYSFDTEKSECVLNPMGSENNCDDNQGRKHDHTWCSVGKIYKAPVNGLCDSYYDCQDGLLTLQKCIWPMKFNPKDNECQINYWPYLFQCFDPKTNTSQQPNTKNETSPDVKCKEGSTHALTDPSDCSKYYECENGKETIKECDYWQLFDPKSNKCRYSTPWNKVDCHHSTSATTPKSVTTTPVTSVPKTSASPDTKNELVCLKGNYYIVGDNNDCQKYYVCSNGSLSIKKCWGLYRFDHVSCECKVNIPFYNNVNCKSLSAKPGCKVGYNYKTVYHGNSNKYYDCNNGTLEVKDCGTMRTYVPSNQQCKWSIFGLKLQSQNNQQFELQHNKFVCNEGSYFNKTYTGDCHMYWTCHNGTLTTAECPYGKKFDSRNGKCTTMTQCDLLSCISKGPLCYPGVQYLTSIPGQCDKYSECKDGQWSTVSCPWLHKFNPTTLECTLSIFKSIDCDAATKCLNTSLVNTVSRFQDKRDSVDSLLKFKQKYEKPQCEKNQIYRTVFPYDCSKYYYCNQGQLTVEKCSFYNKFDPLTLSCRLNLPWYSVNCSSLPGQPMCLHGQEYKRVYPGDCEKYYQCSNGTVTVEKCYFWQRFDPLTLSCRLNIPIMHSVNCSAVPDNNLASSTTTPSVTEPSCGKGQKLKSIYPGNCKNYFNCDNGTETVESCFWLRKFNPATLECSWDLPFYRVNCTAQPGQPTCPEKGITLHPYPGDCKRYYECNNGTLSDKLCGMMQEFDHSKLKCAFNSIFTPVDCGNEG